MRSRRKVIAAATAGMGEGQPTRGRRSPEHKRIQELEREIRRKDKALAETAALLVLKKKTQPEASRHSKPPKPGSPRSSCGTTKSISTAPSASSPSRTGTTAARMRSSPIVVRSTRVHAFGDPIVGAAPPATGSRSRS